MCEPRVLDIESWFEGTANLDAVERALEAEEVQLKKQLEASPLYRRWVVIRKARQQLQALTELDEPPSPSLQTGEISIIRQASSITQAAVFALEDKNQPLKTRDLLELIPQYGRTVGGKQPVWSLSNTLSTDARFRSLVRDDGRAWWFSDRAIPGEEEEQHAAAL